MNQSTPPQTAVTYRKAALTRSKKQKRYFYPLAAIIMLIFMLAGFYPYYLRGEGMAGRKISTQLVTLVFVHGTSTTLWLILFLVQSLLIPTRKLRLHMRFGWGAVAVAIIAAGSGIMLAVQSVRPVPDVPFWGMAYRQFLMVMLAEMSLFATFVLVGVLSRKKPKIHRSMMLLASLSILAGATVRMPILFPIFGESGWLGIFGPIFTLGALLLVVRSVMGRAFDRWLAAGYAVMVVFYLAACTFAVTNSWAYLAKAIFKI